jgi:hypothetical protein
MEKAKRVYTGKDVDMLTAIATITEAAIAHKTELIAKRPAWADPFFANLKTKIETVTQTYLGIDSLQELRQSTQVVTAVVTQAKNDLKNLKVQLETDFSKDKTKLNEILTALGFKQYYSAAAKGKQQDMVSLLYRFKQNMSTQWEADITAKGIDPSIIANIKGYAQTLNTANVTQESLKGSKEVTGEAIKAFNEVYEEVIGVTKIAATFFADKPSIKAKFNYRNTIEALSGKGQAEEKPQTPVAKPA